MPYNDDAREPSSVTGRALGTAALAVGLGGSGMLTYKLGKGVLSLGKKAGVGIKNSIQRAATKPVTDAVKESSILQVLPDNVVPNKNPNTVLQNAMDDVSQKSRNSATGQGIDDMVSEAVIDKELRSKSNILQTDQPIPDRPILKSASQPDIIKNPDFSEVDKNYSYIKGNMDTGRYMENMVPQVRTLKPVIETDASKIPIKTSYSNTKKQIDEVVKDAPKTNPIFDVGTRGIYNRGTPNIEDVTMPSKITFGGEDIQLNTVPNTSSVIPGGVGSNVNTNTGTNNSIEVNTKPKKNHQRQRR